VEESTWRGLFLSEPSVAWSPPSGITRRSGPGIGHGLTASVLYRVCLHRGVPWFGVAAVTGAFGVPEGSWASTAPLALCRAHPVPTVACNTAVG